MILSFTTGRPNERAHPVSEVMASSDCPTVSPVSPGGPRQQSSSSDQRGCEDYSHGGKRNRGVEKDGSFETEISGSLDEALEKLFNN